MTFTTAEEVKKWFRNLPLAKKELNLKLKFYTDLIQTRRVDTADGTGAEKALAFYRQQAAQAQARYHQTLEDTERLLGMLDADERTVLTAKYLNRVSWDAMEFHVYYSRRQCFRIHDRALEKLVGQQAGGGADDGQ